MAWELNYPDRSLSAMSLVSRKKDIILMKNTMRAVRNSTTTIAVASGKGGVGKTTVVANLAIAFSMLKRNVMILDADLGLGNIEVLLNLVPRHTILDLLNNSGSLGDIVMKGPHGVRILSAGAGVQELTALDSFQRFKILESFDASGNDIDILLIDTAAGISDNVLFFCVAAREIVVVTSPEPASISDANSLIKVLHTRHQEKAFHILVNSARGADEALETFRRISVAAEEFAGISLDYLGYLPFDESVQAAIRAQRAFVDLAPQSPASRAIMDIARKFLAPGDRVKGSLQFFIGKLLSSRRPAR